MKRKSLATIIASACLATVAVMAAPPNPTTWLLSWDPPTNAPLATVYQPKTNSAYKVYGTATLGTPTNTWQFMIMFTNWGFWTNSQGKLQYTNSVSVPSAGDWFFEMTSTNFQGETTFSPPDHTGPIGIPAQNLGLLAPQ